MRSEKPADYMVKGLVTLNQKNEVFDAVRPFLTNWISGRQWMLDDVRRLVGQISRRDVLRAAGDRDQRRVHTGAPVA